MPEILDKEHRQDLIVHIVSTIIVTFILLKILKLK